MLACLCNYYSFGHLLLSPAQRTIRFRLELDRGDDAHTVLSNRGGKSVNGRLFDFQRWLQSTAEQCGQPDPYAGLDKAYAIGPMTVDLGELHRLGKWEWKSLDFGIGAGFAEFCAMTGL